LSRASKEAKLRWTDERTGAYGVIDAGARDLVRLYDAWVTLRDEVQAG